MASLIFISCVLELSGACSFAFRLLLCSKACWNSRSPVQENLGLLYCEEQRAQFRDRDGYAGERVNTFSLTSTGHGHAAHGQIYQLSRVIWTCRILEERFDVDVRMIAFT